ncbi:hypothetical protein pipiens_006520 [Culex pipiens pipiens]|uniref:Uncharacterized protein n=1 Tax=Culex pipiens pipiens TaxID=38569 RepID=A0ABD1DPX4_CULPP
MTIARDNEMHQLDVVDKKVILAERPESNFPVGFGYPVGDSGKISLWKLCRTYIQRRQQQVVTAKRTVVPAMPSFDR